MDIGGPAVLLSIGDVGVIPQGGAHPSSGFIGVGQFTTPITAVGYNVFGTFMLPFMKMLDAHASQIQLRRRDRGVPENTAQSVNVPTTANVANGKAM